MTADDVTATLKLELEASGCNRANVVQKPRLLSDNGSSYISGDLAEWLEDHVMDHVRGAPYHPQTQGKIERWHQTLKNRILPSGLTSNKDEPDPPLLNTLNNPDPICFDDGQPRRSGWGGSRGSGDGRRGDGCVYFDSNIAEKEGKRLRRPGSVEA